MANRIKRNTGIDANSINTGNWSIGIDGTGMGPTSSSGFQNGLIIPAGGYVIYSTGINARIASNDTELVFIINKLGGIVSTVAEALTWAKDNDILVLNKTIDNVVTDGLAAYLDSSYVTSYVDNTSIVTTNVVTNWNLDTGWSKGYQREIVFNEIEPPYGVDAPTVGFNRGTSSAYWYSYGNYAPQTPGSTYTVSVYVKTNDPSFAINYYTADNSETGRVWGPHIAVPNDGQWHRVVWPAFTNPSNSQSESLSFNMQMSGGYGNTSQNRTWLCAPQMELGTTATPFVKGTRYKNVTWYDLSGNGNHATIMNGTTFSENALEFDGSDDYAVINEFIEKPTTQITCDAWIKPMKSTLSGTIRGGAISASNSMYLGIIDSVDGGNNHAMHWANQTTVNRQYNWNGQIPNNKWSHIVGTYDGSVSRAYVNGVEIANWSQTGTIPDATYYIGTYGGTIVDGTHNFDGLIKDAKIYNKALTSSQVLQNYCLGPVVTSGLRLVCDAANPISYESGASGLKNIINGDTEIFTIEGVGEYSTENGGILKLNQGRIYRSNVGWYGKMAISWWMRYNGAPSETNFYTESYRGSGGCARIYSPILANGKFRFSAWDNSSIGPLGRGSFSVDTTTIVADGNWHHVTCQWSNGTGNQPRGIYVYVDGALEGYTDMIGNDGSYSHLHLGGATGCVGDSTHDVDFGPIIHYSNYNLSDNEVYQNYSAHAARFK